MLAGVPLPDNLGATARREGAAELGEYDDSATLSLRVLLVDDDEDDFIITRDLLAAVETCYYRLDWLASYDEAIEALVYGEHDVCLLDYRLGNENGLDLLRAAQSAGATTPMILMTGQGDPSVDHEAMRSGAADYLVKGRIDPPYLERTLRYAAERGRAVEALRQLSIRDALTGLYNRRELDRMLREESDRCVRYGREMALVLLDIDHFKRVNDSYGHQVGDEVLRWLGGLLQDSLRSSDKPISLRTRRNATRYGGEEFALILPETDAAGATVLAERLRQTIANTPFAWTDRHGQDHSLSITVSIGVASFGESDRSTEAMLANADHALYAAKHQGRNRTVQL